MITTMAGSGSTEEQMKSFITNNQNLSKLPSDESQWTISIPSPEEDNDIPTTSFCLSLEDLNRPKAAKKFNNSSWPPVNWKSAPGFEHAVNTKAFGNPNPQKRRDVKSDVTKGLIENDADQITEENPASTIPSSMVSAAATGYNRPNTSSSNLISTDQLNWGTVTPQQVITGRTGELVAFQYFVGKHGVESVKWVNEVKEPGLPFDIIIEGENNSKEYIEVKATSNANKDWFVITVKEWQFAVEQGESFTIARVLVSNGNLVWITTYRNPVKLCKSRHLQLAILSSQSAKDEEQEKYEKMLTEENRQSKIFF
ncbi:histidine kinase-, DNA gyrase B-, and HSP90-like ATPase family protein [Tanacetum coccineum]